MHNQANFAFPIEPKTIVVLSKFVPATGVPYSRQWQHALRRLEARFAALAKDLGGLDMNGAGQIRCLDDF